jgi:nitrate reductase gamma subunit
MDKHLIFYAMFIPSLLFFFWGMWLHITLYLQGTIKGVSQGTPWQKIRVLLLQGGRSFRARPRFFVRVFITDVIFHRKLLSQSFYRWLTHSLLVFGFAATFIVDMIKGFTTGYLVELSHTFPFFSFAHIFETGAIRPFLDFFLEFFSFLILAGCVLAIVRRFVLRPSQLRNEEEDIVTLLFILFLEISGFFIEGYRIAHPEVTSSRIYMANFTPASANSWVSFGGYFLSLFLRGVRIDANFLWYMHVVPSLLWLIYIPHSKLLHIFTSSATVIADRAKQTHLARLRFPSQAQVSAEHEHPLPSL